MIRRSLLAAAAVLTLGTGTAMAASIGPSDVGSLIFDENWVAIGSLQAIQGNEAVVRLGLFNRPGSHLTTIPVSQLASRDGSVVLDASAAQKLAAR